MEQKPEYEPLGNRIELLSKYAETHKEITLFEIVSLFGHSSYFFLSLFMVMPFLQPIPLFGLSTIIGTSLAFFSAFIIADQKLYMPDRMKQYKVKAPTIKKWCRYFLAFCAKTDKWLHPRASYLHKTALLRIVNGMIIFCSSLLLALPIPFPATNTLPAITIAVIALGSLREDIVAVFVGWALFIASLAYLGSIILLPFAVGLTTY